MNILIADQLGSYRFDIKSLFLEKWPKVLVYETDSFEEMAELVKRINFHLLILDIEILVNKRLDDFMALTTDSIKMVTLSEFEWTNDQFKFFLQLGVNAVFYRSSTKEPIIATAEFLLTSKCFLRDNNFY